MPGRAHVQARLVRLDDHRDVPLVDDVAYLDVDLRDVADDAVGNGDLVAYDGREDAPSRVAARDRGVVVRRAELTRGARARRRGLGRGRGRRARRRRRRRRGEDGRAEERRERAPRARDRRHPVPVSPRARVCSFVHRPLGFNI